MSRVRCGVGRSSRRRVRKMVAQDRFNRGLQGRKIAVNDVPDGLQVNGVVLMTKYVAKAMDSAPIRVWTEVFFHLLQTIGRFGDDAQPSLDRVLLFQESLIYIKTESTDVTLDAFDALQNFVQIHHGIVLRRHRWRPLPRFP